MVLARKTRGVGLIYAVLTVCSVILFIRAISGADLSSKDGIAETVIECLFGAGAAALCGYFALRYLLLPADVIRLSDAGELLLPAGITVALSEVKSVSFRRTVVLTGPHRYGTVILVTGKALYRVPFVADCAGAANRVIAAIRAFGEAPFPQDGKPGEESV